MLWILRPQFSTGTTCFLFCSDTYLTHSRSVNSLTEDKGHVG